MPMGISFPEEKLWQVFGMTNSILLITGASSELALELLRTTGESYDAIYAQYHSHKEGLEALRVDLGDKLHLLQADFSDEIQTQKFVSLLEEVPVTHILLLSAQPVFNQRFSKLNWHDFEGAWSIQVRSAFYILQALLSGMAKRKFGRVVICLSSYVEHIPPKFLSSYVTAKYAMLGLLKALSAEYAEKKIAINGVSPSMMETRFLANISPHSVEQCAQDAPLKRNATVRDVAPVIRLLLSDDSEYITGQNIMITGGNMI